MLFKSYFYKDMKEPSIGNFMCSMYLTISMTSSKTLKVVSGSKLNVVDVNSMSSFLIFLN